MKNHIKTIVSTIILAISALLPAKAQSVYVGTVDEIAFGPDGAIHQFDNYGFDHPADWYQYNIYTMPNGGKVWGIAAYPATLPWGATQYNATCTIVVCNWQTMFYGFGTPLYITAWSPTAGWMTAQAPAPRFGDLWTAYRLTNYGNYVAAEIVGSGRTPRQPKPTSSVQVEGWLPPVW